MGHVVVVLDQDAKAINKSLVATCDLFVTAKAPLDTLQLLRERKGVPVGMWHDDYCAWTPKRLEWMHASMPLVDAATLSDGLFAAQYSHARHDLAGINYEAKPTRLLPVNNNSVTIFAGGYNPTKDTTERIAKLKLLRPQCSYGLPQKVALEIGARYFDETPQPRMVRVYNGNVGLSPVRDPEMRFYMSNRAGLIAGGNGLLYAEAFDGCEAFFSDQEAIWYKEAKPYKFDPSHVEIQTRGRERAWRDYSWPVVTRRFMQSLGY